MPKLNEYLGGIVSEIASARKMADLQTVQIAQEYAKDDLLKHFSIPRMKVGTVDLTIPFATAENSIPKIFRNFMYDEIIKVAKTDYNSTDTKNDQSLKDFLVDLEVYYKDAIKKVQSENTPTITNKQLEYFEIIPTYTLEFCLTLPNFKWKQTDKNLFLQSISNKMFSEARKVIERTQDFEIIVEASQLMALDTKCLIYAKMSITEAGMEWSRYEDINGNIIETLIPE